MRGPLPCWTQRTHPRNRTLSLLLATLPLCKCKASQVLLPDRKTEGVAAQSGKYRRGETKYRLILFRFFVVLDWHSGCTKTRNHFPERQHCKIIEFVDTKLRYMISWTLNICLLHCVVAACYTLSTFLPHFIYSPYSHPWKPKVLSPQ